jgi:hypothetical protein
MGKSEQDCSHAEIMTRRHTAAARLGANLNLAPGHQNLFLFFLEFTFKGMFGAVAWFREIAVGAIHHRIRITVRELACHGVVTGLGAIVGFERTLPAVGIVMEMIGSMSGHGASAVNELKEYRLAYAERRDRATAKNSWLVS